MSNPKHVRIIDKSNKAAKATVLTTSEPKKYGTTKPSYLAAHLAKIQFEEMQAAAKKKPVVKKVKTQNRPLTQREVPPPPDNKPEEIEPPAPEVMWKMSDVDIDVLMSPKSRGLGNSISQTPFEDQDEPEEEIVLRDEVMQQIFQSPVFNEETNYEMYSRTFGSLQGVVPEEDVVDENVIKLDSPPNAFEDKDSTPKIYTPVSSFDLISPEITMKALKSIGEAIHGMQALEPIICQVYEKKNEVPLETKGYKDDEVIKNGNEVCDNNGNMRQVSRTPTITPLTQDQDYCYENNIPPLPKTNPPPQQVDQNLNIFTSTSSFIMRQNKQKEILIPRIIKFTNFVYPSHFISTVLMRNVGSTPRLFKVNDLNEFTRYQIRPQYGFLPASGLSVFKIQALVLSDEARDFLHHDIEVLVADADSNMTSSPKLYWDQIPNGAISRYKIQGVEIHDIHSTQPKEENGNKTNTEIPFEPEVDNENEEEEEELDAKQIEYLLHGRTLEEIMHMGYIKISKSIRCIEALNKERETTKKIAFYIFGLALIGVCSYSNVKEFLEINFTPQPTGFFTSIWNLVFNYKGA